MATTANRIFYRFVHETDDSFKPLEFTSYGITAADAKILVAKASGLEHEFARTFDLRLSLYLGADILPKEIGADTELITGNAKIVVQRVPWRARHAIEHVAGQEQAAAPVARPLRPFPTEYICPFCEKMLSQPVVIRCGAKCGKSACRNCVEDRFSSQERTCPVCKGAIQSVIPNKALAAIISMLDLEEFEEPSAPTEAPVQAPTVPEDEILPPFLPVKTEPPPPGLEETKQPRAVVVDDTMASAAVAAVVKKRHVEEEAIHPSVPHVAAPSSASQRPLLSMGQRRPPFRGGGKYVYDATSNSWTPVREQHPMPSEEGAECPFRSTTELACLFPQLSNKDFHLIRAFQAQLKALLEAERKRHVTASSRGSRRRTTPAS